MPWFDTDNNFNNLDVITSQLRQMLGDREGRSAHGETIAFVEEQDAYVAHADLPGFGNEQIGVRVENGVLTVEARRDWAAPDGATAVHRERGSVALQRSWRIPSSVDDGQIGAHLVDGVLTLRLPKRPEAAPRRVSIETLS